MRPLTNSLPKVLLPLGQKKIFEWTHNYLHKQGVQSLAVNMHHGLDSFQAYLKTQTFEINITPFIEKDILGTGGAIKNMKSFVTDDYFFVINCDIMTELNMQDMFAFHLEKKALATLFIPDQGEKKYTPIFVDPNNQIRSILSPTPGHIEAGIFGGISIFSKDIFKHLPREGHFCLVRDLLEPLCQKALPIFGFRASTRWYDTGELDLYHQTCEILESHPLNWMT